jgi:hypothetical protein
MQFERGLVRGIADDNGAFLRQVVIADEEVFRGVGFVARDANWGTPALAASPRLVEHGGVLTIESAGNLSAASGDLSWTIAWTIADDTIDGRVQWTSRNGFLTNRTGLVVLHSLDASRGRAVQVTRPDRRSENFAFPELVSPHQPFLDISAMAYETSAGNRLRIVFEGEVFEIEDQRNWSDASFKTYSRPLRLPFPYRIAPGERQAQSVRVEFVARSPSSRPAGPSGPTIGAASPMPLIGTTLPPGPPSNSAVEALAELALNFTAIELDPSEKFVNEDIDAKLEAAGPHARVDLRPGALEAVRHCLDWLAPKLQGRSLIGVTLWGADDAMLVEARKALGSVPLGTGSASNFAELNRTHPLPAADYLAWASNPTVHGDTDDTIGETTEVCEDFLATILNVAPEGAFHIGPMTLGPRFNPVATTPEGRAGAKPDPRQISPIAAAWAVGTLAGYLAPAVRSLAFFEPVGPKGLISAAGALTPTGTALRRLAALKGRSARALRWPQQPRARGILIEGEAGASLCVTCCQREPVRLALPDRIWRAERLVQTGFEQEAERTGRILDLEGFSVAWLSEAE